MGLLDKFGSLDDTQTQGLLAAASQMLQNSGPSRTPVGFGQIAGAGLDAYQGTTLAAKRRKAEEERAALEAKMYGLKIRDSESDFANQEAARKRAAGLQQFYMDQGKGGAPIGQSAQMPAAPGASAAGGGSSGLYQQRLAMAEALRAQGYGPEADAAEAAAMKFQPKVKGWEKVQQGGKVMFAPFYEDGTSGQPVPMEVAEKLNFQNIGGKTIGQNAYTGATVSSVNNTATPDAIMADRRARQTAEDARNREARPVFNAEVGGFISPPSKNLPNGAITALDGFDKRAPKAPTEFQGKSAAFGLRAAESHKVINDLIGKGTTNGGLIKGAVEGVPLIGGALGTAVNTLPRQLGGPNSDQQAFRQAKRDFINATLRQESGAAIGPSEFENADKQYFPEPGDTDAVIAQKARNRELVIQGFDSNAGRHAIKPAAKTSGGWSIRKVD